mmetsp:Transcript_99996/g.322313  ORF Transcript_99996/g.322313 Transcript_99996/m.322313 type:complete len:809 (-) Transcript_99996:144-2570(-)
MTLAPPSWFGVAAAAVVSFLVGLVVSRGGSNIETAPLSAHKAALGEYHRATGQKVTHLRLFDLLSECSFELACLLVAGLSVLMWFAGVQLFRLGTDSESPSVAEPEQELSPNDQVLDGSADGSDDVRDDADDALRGPLEFDPLGQAEEAAASADALKANATPKRPLAAAVAEPRWDPLDFVKEAQGDTSAEERQQRQLRRAQIRHGHHFCERIAGVVVRPVPSRVGRFDRDVSRSSGYSDVSTEASGDWFVSSESVPAGSTSMLSDAEEAHSGDGPSVSCCADAGAGPRPEHREEPQEASSQAASDLAPSEGAASSQEVAAKAAVAQEATAQHDDADAAAEEAAAEAVGAAEEDMQGEAKEVEEPQVASWLGEASESAASSEVAAKAAVAQEATAQHDDADAAAEEAAAEAVEAAEEDVQGEAKEVEERALMSGASADDAAAAAAAAAAATAAAQSWDERSAALTVTAFEEAADTVAAVAEALAAVAADEDADKDNEEEEAQDLCLTSSKTVAAVSAAGTSATDAWSRGASMETSATDAWSSCALPAGRRWDDEDDEAADDAPAVAHTAAAGLAEASAAAAVAGQHQRARWSDDQEPAEGEMLTNLRMYGGMYFPQQMDMAMHCGEMSYPMGMHVPMAWQGCDMSGQWMMPDYSAHTFQQSVHTLQQQQQQQQPVPNQQLRSIPRRPRAAQSSNNKDDKDMTLRAIMQVLEEVDPKCVLQVRRIKHLGFGSMAVLREHMSQFGEVDRVLVSHSRAQTRVRPASLGFVIMCDPAGTLETLAHGLEQPIGGACIRLGAFERHSAAATLEE